MPAGALLGTPATLNLRDAGNEPCTFHVFGVVLTAANFAAKRALWVTLMDAALALVLGDRSGESYGTSTPYDWDQPTNGAAREIALRVRYKDGTTGQRFTAKLPTLDPTLPDYIVNEDARDVLDMTAPAAITDFIAAFEAFVVNPFTGNAAEVTGIQVVRGAK